MGHYENTKLISLDEIYQEKRNEYDWFMVNREDGFELYTIDFLQNQSEELFFQDNFDERKIYKFIDQKNGSKLFGKMLPTRDIIAVLVEEHPESFDIS